MARIVELTESDLLMFQQDVTSFKRTIESVEEVVRASAEDIGDIDTVVRESARESTDLLQSITDLCATLRTMTLKLEQVLVVNERLEKLLLRIEVLTDEEPNTSITEEEKHNTDIRELQPPDIFAPCDKCHQASCQCIKGGGEPVCESCLEDPCVCMAQYETRADTTL